MTSVPPTQPPAAPETEAHRDSYPMGNINHGTPDNPNWGTFCVECKQSWPCDVSRLLERVWVVEGERDAAMSEAEMALRMHDVQCSRAESAEAAHRALQAAVEDLADQWDKNADSWPYAVWHDQQKSNAHALRALLAGGEER